MRKIFTSLCLIAAALGASASINGYRSVYLNHTDGSSDIIAMEEDMTMNVVADELVLSCSKGKITVPIAELRNWTYGTLEGSDEQWMGVSLPGVDAVTVRMNNDCVEILNLPNAAAVSLTAIDGRTITSIRSYDGYARIGLSDIRNGVYILTYNNKSIKIAVK